MERVRDLLDAVSPTLDLGDSLVARLSQRRGSSGGSTSANIAAEDYSSDLQIREVRRWGGGGGARLIAACMGVCPLPAPPCPPVSALCSFPTSHTPHLTSPCPLPSTLALPMHHVLFYLVCRQCVSRRRPPLVVRWLALPQLK
jgi:hypothetical protein